MLKSSNPDLSQIKKQHPLDDDHHHQIKKDDKLFGTCSRVVSKETSTGNPSFRVLYYGGVSGAVPFMWETQPGTPKHKLFSDHSTPPTLTPPPSYYFSSPREKQPIKKHDYFSSKLLNNIFFHLKKSQLPLSPSSSYSSSKSVPASHSKIKLHRRRRLLSIGSSFDHDNDVDHDYQVSTPNHNRSNSSSMLCFGGLIRFWFVRWEMQSERRILLLGVKSNYLSLFMKKASKSLIVGRGSIRFLPMINWGINQREIN